MTYTTPCEKCIHNKVCGAKNCINDTNVEIKTTHPYFIVEIACTEFMPAAPTIIETTENNNDYTWAKELIKRTGLSIAPEDGSKPYGYDLEDKVWRSDVIDLFGHGSTYTSEEAQKMIKNLPSAE